MDVDVDEAECLYFVFTDCANLSCSDVMVQARGFATQKEMDEYIEERNFECDHQTQNLPKYFVAIDMVVEEDEIYSTDLSLNDNCCGFFVLKSRKYCTYGEGTAANYLVQVEEKMLKEVFSRPTE